MLDERQKRLEEIERSHPDYKKRVREAIVSALKKGAKPMTAEEFGKWLKEL